jgi:hypothetical protein
MSNVVVSLYHSDNCGHCLKKNPEFKKEWDNFNKDAKEKGYIVHTYEEKEIPQDMENNIKYFPTIKIKIGNKDYEYEGSRTSGSIQNFIDNKMNQSGGNPFPPGTFMTPAVGMPVNPALSAMGQPPLLNPSVLASPTVVANQPLLGGPGLVGSPMGMMGNPGLVGTSMGLGMNGMIGVGFDDECNKCRKYKKKYHKYKKIAARLLEKYNQLKKD